MGTERPSFRDRVTLSLTRNKISFAPVGDTRNERGVADTAIEGIGTGSDLYARIISMDAVQAGFGIISVSFNFSFS